MVFRLWMVALLILIVTGCGGGGGGSTTFLAAPAITAEAESTKVIVSWREVPSALSYNIYWSTDPSITKATAHKITASHSPYVHSGLSANTAYYYFVTSVSAEGVESGASNIIAMFTTTVSNKAPSVSFAHVASALYGEPVVIDARASSDIDGTITEYQFDFGDGTPPLVQTSPVASHVFSNRGTFSVTVKVTDDAGASSALSTDIAIGLAIRDVANVSSNPTLSQGAVAAVDGSGRVGIVWSDASNLMFAGSAPGGTSFTTLGSWTAPNYTFYNSAIVSAGGEYYLSFAADSGTAAAEIAFMRTTGGGQSFSTPVIVSTIDDVSSNGSSISVEGSNIVIAWSDNYVFGVEPRPHGITYSRSTDGGKTFSRPTILAPGDAPKVNIRNGRTYLSWLDGNANAILFAYSDDGVSFTSPKDLSATRTARVWSPQMATAPDGTIYVMWSQNEDAAPMTVMLSVSRDGGATFSAPAIISDRSMTAWTNSLVVGQDGTVYVAWTTGTHWPSPPLRTYLQYSVDHGATFSPAMRITAIDEVSGGASLLPITTDKVGLVWWGPVWDGLPDVRYATLQIPH